MRLRLRAINQTKPICWHGIFQDVWFGFPVLDWFSSCYSRNKNDNEVDTRNSRLKQGHQKHQIVTWPKAHLSRLLWKRFWDLKFEKSLKPCWGGYWLAKKVHFSRSTLKRISWLCIYRTLNIQISTIGGCALECIIWSLVKTH